MPTVSIHHDIGYVTESSDTESSITDSSGYQ